MPPLPIAFVARQGSRIRLDGGLLVVEHPDFAKTTIPLGQIGGLVTLGAVELTSAAIAALAERDLGCVLASRGGRARAILTSQSPACIARRRAQHVLQFETQDNHPCARACARNPSAMRLAIARRIVTSKVDAMLGILAQHHRTHDDVDLSLPIAAIRAMRIRAADASSIDTLRGFEGAAAARYFGALPALCRGELTTSNRSRRPPRDPFNAALSFGYTLLVNEVHAGILARGLEPTLGLLHPPQGARPSLALDLVEPLRHAVIDRLVLRASNRRELLASDFEMVAAETEEFDAIASEADSVHVGGNAGVTNTSGRGRSPAPHACRLTDHGRARFLGLYHEAMDAPMAIPRDAGHRALQGRVRDLIAQAIDAYERDLAVEQPELPRGSGAPEHGNPPYAPNNECETFGRSPAVETPRSEGEVNS